MFLADFASCWFLLMLCIDMHCVAVRSGWHQVRRPPDLPRRIPTNRGRKIRSGYAVQSWESSIRFIAFLLWNQFSNFEQLWKRRRTGINHLFMWFASALRMSSRFVDVCWSSSMFNQSLRSWTLIVLSRDALTIFDRWKVIAVRYLAEYKDEPLVGDVAVDSCVLFSTCFEFQTTSQKGVEFGVISSTLRPLLRESRH